MTIISSKVFIKSPQYQSALDITRRLKSFGHQAYFVGGAVRDMIIGRTPKDIDIATSASPEQVGKIFPHHYEVGASFGVMVVVENGINFEVASLREERDYNDGRHPDKIFLTNDLRLDAARRDFTINAMYYDPFSDEVIDFHHGQEDLEQGVLRCVGNPEQRFQEDHLRMLRAVRFAARFNLRIDNEVTETIRKLRKLVSRLSAERIRQELTMMLIGPNPAKAFRMLRDLAVLELVLPEVAAMDGVEQPPQFHPEGDVFTHTMLMLEHMVYPTVELAWSVLLHDVGKPDSLTRDEEGMLHFYGHERHGRNMAERIMKRLRFSKEQTSLVVHAVGDHMRFAAVGRMRRAKLLKMISAPGFTMELELHRLDCLCSNGLLENFNFLLDILNEYDGIPEAPEPLLTGKDLLKLKIAPGPLYSKILRAVEEMRLEEKIGTKEEALAVAIELSK